MSAGDRSLTFAELARSAYFARVPLSATGFYATPKVHYDRTTLSGRPFFYYAYGAAVAEVAIDTLTGEHRLLAVDILHDVGDSLNPAIDRGQIEGGFLQGWGWLAMEELWWNARGELGTHAPSTYKIPTARDWPDRVRIDFWPEPNREDTIYRSKAVGEPPFMLALVGVPRAARRDRERRGLRAGAAARRAGDRRAHPGRDRRAAVADPRMIANLAWPDALRAAIARGERAVIVAVAGAAGSTPRESGAAMVVTRDRIAGTIGGGHLEYEAMRLAREALAGNAAVPAHWLVRFPLAARLGQCCGGVATLAFAVVDASAATWLDGVAALRSRLGTVCGGRPPWTWRRGGGTPGRHRRRRPRHARRGPPRCRRRRRRARSNCATARRATGGSGALDVAGVPLFVHVVRPAAFPVCVFGNGHVGRALVQVLGALPASVQWYDTREHDFPASVPGNVEVVVTDAPEGDVDHLPTGAYVVVMTHSHALDFDIVEAALHRDDWRYLGLIGSRAKRHQFERRLEARGVAPEALTRVTCPIGRGDLKSKEPGVIAVAVAAEILAIREALAAGCCCRHHDAAPGGVRAPTRGKAG